MFSIKLRMMRVAQILTLIAGFAFVAGNVESVAAASSPQTRTPAALAQKMNRGGIIDIRGDDRNDGRNGRASTGCEALAPWISDTRATIDTVIGLYQDLEDAAAESPEAGAAAIENLADELGDVVRDMSKADVPAGAEAVHENLTERLDAVAVAYSDLIDAAYTRDEATFNEIFAEIPELEDQLIDAIFEFESMAEECETGLEEGGQRDRTQRDYR